MTNEELDQIKQDTLGSSDTEYLSPSEVWDLILRLEAAEAVATLAEAHVCRSWSGPIGAALQAWYRSKEKKAEAVQ